MSFFKFVFSFLYVRNWHTGVAEISKPRLYTFLSFLFLVLLATSIIAILNTPIEYRAA